MMTENNFSDRLASWPSGGPSPQAIRAACWRHYRRHWWQGLLLGMLALGIIELYDQLRCAPTGFSLKMVGSGGFAGATIIWGLMLVCFVGVPSAVGGLLRQPWLRWLCRQARSRWHLVGGSMFGFEANVALLVLWYWWLTYPHHTTSSVQKLAYFAGLFQVVSLPWLFSTAWASWRLAAELRMPPREENTPL